MNLEKIGVLDTMDFIVDKHDVMTHYVDYWYRLLNNKTSIWLGPSLTVRI